MTLKINDRDTMAFSVFFVLFVSSYLIGKHFT